jgi:site-specific DNA recombinase
MPSTNGHGPKRAILYTRVSTDEQARSGYSLAQQLEALRDYAAREGYEILEEIADPGQSGASLERPGMDRVRDLVAAGGVSVVLAQDRDRFAREPAYHYLLRREFGEYGCKMRALNDRGDDSPEGELTDGILDQLTKFERAKTAERTRRGKLQKAREGKIIAVSRPIYGFRLNESRDGYEVDNETMPIVRRIFRMIGVEGSSLNNVKRTLEREGIPTPSARTWWNRDGGRYWSHKTLKDILKSAAYRPHTYSEIEALVSPEVASRLDPDKRYGISWWGKRRVITKQVAYTKPDGTRGYRKKQQAITKPESDWIACPVPDAGIPLEVVDAAREALAHNRAPSKAGGRFWELSGKLLYCGGCGSIMSASRHRKRTNGGYYNYYRCNKRHYQGTEVCPDARMLRAADLEARVWEEVSGVLKEPMQLRAGLEAMIEAKKRAIRGDPEKQIKHWHTVLVKLERKRDGYLDQHAEGIITMAELKDKLAALDEPRRVAERELRALQNYQADLEDLETEKDALLERYMEITPRGLDLFTPEDRLETYKALHLRVTVYPGGDLELSWPLEKGVELCDLESTSRSTPKPDLRSPRA